MKFDMIVSGVGGQGILSISFVIDNAALKENLHFKQSEVHGMAQRGGAVISHIRISDREIFSDLVPTGSADLLLSMEPLESLRYLHFLKPEGEVVSSSSTFVNIPDYPDVDTILGKIQSSGKHTIVNAADLARAAGSHQAQNMVLLGAASHSLPLENKTLEEFIGILFQTKGEKVVEANINAFRNGALAGSFYRALLAGGMKPADAVALATRLEAGNYSGDMVNGWIDICVKDSKGNLINWLKEKKGLLPGGSVVLSALSKLNLKTAVVQDFEKIFL